MRRKGFSYIKDWDNFINKLQRMASILHNTILVTANITVLYSNIPHNVGFKALREVVGKREQKKNPTEKLVQISSRHFIEKQLL